jgi:hypothetical protein
MDVLTDVGTVVELSYMGSQDRVDQSTVDDVFTWPPIGVMLTNAVSPDDGMGGYTGGYCVVGCSDPMVVRLAASSGTPGTAAKLYLQKADGTAGGATDQADEAVGAPCPLGYCMPVGPTGATRLRYMTWEPQPPNSITVKRASSLSITSSTVLVDFASVAVKAGRRYAFEANLSFTANVAGGIDVAWQLVGATATDILCTGFILADAPPATLSAVACSMGPGGPMTCVGPTSGVAKLNGVITVTADGTLSVQAAQHASNPGATLVYYVSWFRVTEV